MDCWRPPMANSVRKPLFHVTSVHYGRHSCYKFRHGSRMAGRNRTRPDANALPYWRGSPHSNQIWRRMLRLAIGHGTLLRLRGGQGATSRSVLRSRGVPKLPHSTAHLSLRPRGRLFGGLGWDSFRYCCLPFGSSSYNRLASDLNLPPGPDVGGPP